MAIEKMSLIKIVGSVEDMHEILKKLVLSEKMHVDFQNAGAFDNSYIIHEYESEMHVSNDYSPEDPESVEQICAETESRIERLYSGLGIKPAIDKESIAGSYGIRDAREDLQKLEDELGQTIGEVSEKKSMIAEYEQFKEKLGAIKYRDIDFDSLASLNYFDYEVGTLSSDNRYSLRKNYENISAVALNIGTVKESTDDMYIIIFPKKFRDETERLLKSLNWDRLNIPSGLSGSVSNMISQLEERIAKLQADVSELEKVLSDKKDQVVKVLNKVYSALKLEKRILRLEKRIDYVNGTFVVDAWIRKKDSRNVHEIFGELKNKVMIEEKDISRPENNVMPPTLLRNSRFLKPFESVIRMYGLPSYYEIDPTPFFAVAFCLMFGIMFGDIGQGAIYLLAGLLLYRKGKKVTIGRLLIRLGASSIVFGFVYGSLFGLEHSELPWLPTLIGKPLDPRNIPMILIAGVIFGTVVLTISFVLGIINSLRKKDIETGIFGKNGAAGWAFFISLELAAVSVTGVISLPIAVPLLAMLISLLVMLAKTPLAGLVTGKRPLIHGTVSSYLTESFFEGVETILGTLSNAISFIRVGAFALNHAGLFLAFLVMSEMTENIALKLLILVLGNVLILTLEGLVVFIQGLRLEYYEMFSKYFNGGGTAFRPVTINN